MKKQTQINFSQISKAATENLTNTVKETLATDVNRQKKFSAADLWDIQRRGRTMSQRLHYTL